MKKEMEFPLFPACPEAAMDLIKVVRKNSDIRRLQEKLESHDEEVRRQWDGMQRRKRKLQLLLKLETSRRDRALRHLDEKLKARAKAEGRKP